MSLLPPDPARLRAILAYLEEQIARSGTAATYLRLQRDAVAAALADVERPPRQRPRRKTNCSTSSAMSASANRSGRRQ